MMPNFGRWGTVSAAAKIVLENWTAFWFMGKVILNIEPADSYVAKIAKSLLDLMSAKADKKQKTPSHYVSLLFFSAFCEDFFDPNMEWMKRNDPVFGAGSYGNISRLVPEHLYILFNQLGTMKNDGWKSIPAFKQFLTAVDELMPEKGEVRYGGKEFFVKLPKVFLGRFESSFRAQTVQWRTKDIICMAIAGNPTIAKWLLRWIFEMPGLPNTTAVMQHKTKTRPKIVQLQFY